MPCNFTANMIKTIANTYSLYTHMHRLMFMPLRQKLSCVFLMSSLIFCAAAQLRGAELLRGGDFNPVDTSVQSGGVTAGNAANGSWSIYVENRFGGKMAVTLDPAVGHLAPGAFRMSPETNLDGSATVHQSIPVAAGRTYELNGWVMGKNLAGIRLKADYPDPLVPVEGPLTSAAGRNYPFWIDLKVGEKVPAGDHAFTSFNLDSDFYLQARKELGEAIVKAGDVPEVKAQEKAADNKSWMPGFLKKLLGK